MLYTLNTCFKILQGAGLTKIFRLRLKHNSKNEKPKPLTIKLNQTARLNKLGKLDLEKKNKKASPRRS